MGRWGGGRCGAKGLCRVWHDSERIVKFKLSFTLSSANVFLSDNRPRVLEPGSTAGSPGYVLWVVWVRLRMQGPTLSTGVRGSVKVVWERFQRSREQVPRKRAKLSVWQTEFRSP